MGADILEFFCRHLIGIGWYEGRVNEDGEFAETPIFYGASGFLLQLHDELPGSCALITAGHVFADYKQRMSETKMGAKNHSLLDIWGPRSRCYEPIPFHLFDTPVHVRYDKELGVDFAVVPLPDLVLKLLGQTIIPFTKANWVLQSDITFDFFAMLGLPNECAQQITNHKNAVESVTTFQNPAMLFLDPCELPSEITPASNPQFVARIDLRADLDSIVGMSGGPILGFRKNADGQFAYWPVAIQSRWLSDSRIVVGTFVAPIAAAIEQEIEQFVAQGPT